METIITDLRVKLSTGKELGLTAQEARELHAELKKLFELAEPPLPPLPVPGWPVQPIIVPSPWTPPYPQFPPYWEVTYGTTNREPACGIGNTTLFIGDKT